MSTVVQSNTPEDNRFITISDFNDCMIRGGEVEFVWRNTIFNISHTANNISISEAYKQETESLCDIPDEVLEYIVCGDRLRDIITQVGVIYHTI